MLRNLPINLKKKIKDPLGRKVGDLYGSFNFFELFLFYLFAALIFIGSFFAFYKLTDALQVEVPRRGGTITEGVIGTPRFINPLLTISEADRDLTQLVYSGLLKATPDGKLINDLAESYTISPDGLSYHFRIKEDVFFHDGQPVTADDVIFTVTMAQNDALRSSRRASWQGVDLEKVSEKEIVFRLSEAYSPFLENTTMGILPKHLWENFSAEEMAFSELNTRPVGSGPYKIKSLKKDSSGVPTNYILEPFDDYALGSPYIGEIKFKFYKNEANLIEAFNAGSVENINSVSAELVKDDLINGHHVHHPVLPRVFGVFFNRNRAPLFTNKEVRVALDVATDKERIVEEVLYGYGTPISGPIPPGAINKFGRSSAFSKVDDEKSFEDKLNEAKDILERNGWELNEEGILIKETRNQDYILSFSIKTSNSPELKKVAEIVKENWEALGADIEIEIFDIGTLNQEVIRPRDYEALLFGEVVGRDLDLFAFWHSSQRNDPGLNIALYTNISVDKILEEIRRSLDSKEILGKFEEFKEEIDFDSPAVFLYSPDFIYLSRDNIKGIKVGTITTPSERFLNVEDWYINTDKIWSIFE